MPRCWCFIRWVNKWSFVVESIMCNYKHTMTHNKTTILEIVMPNLVLGWKNWVERVRTQKTTWVQTKATGQTERREAPLYLQNQPRKWVWDKRPVRLAFRLKYHFSLLTRLRIKTKKLNKSRWFMFAFNTCVYLFIFSFLTLTSLVKLNNFFIVSTIFSFFHIIFN